MLEGFGAKNVVNKKTRNPLRGPLGYLGCANSAERMQKRFPYRLLPSPAHGHMMHAICQSFYLQQETANPSQLVLGKVVIVLIETPPRVRPLGS